MPMTRRTATDLLIPLDRSDEAPEGLTRQIYTALRAAILSGRLRAGDRLPPTRELARSLGVARLTVATAFEWLRAEGYVYGRVGAGTYVAAVFGEGAPGEPSVGSSDQPATMSSGLSSDQPSNAVSSGRAAAARAPASLPAMTNPVPAPEIPTPVLAAPIPLSSWAQRIASIPLMGSGSAELEALPYDFRPGAGAADAFPWARWRRTVGWPDPLGSEVRSRTRRWDTLLGPREAREAIAAWLRRSRSVRCDAEQVLIASSVQQVLALLARLLIEPGQPLLVEDPSYIGFHAAFLAEGARLVSVPVDEAGVRVDALSPLESPPAHEADQPRLIVVTPSHQYPTGVTLSLERRVALLEWARRAGVVVVEDDYDGELRLEGQPLEAMQGLDGRGEVIYLGTFAKALYPAVRLGFAVLPPWLVEPVARARAASDRHPRWHDALGLARFIESGELERHLLRVRRIYRSRRDALVASVHTHLAGVVRVGPAEAGLHLLAWLPDAVDDVAIASQARAHGLGVTPLSPHYRADAHSGLLLGFGAMSEERLTEGMRRLAPLVASASTRPRER